VSLSPQPPSGGVDARRIDVALVALLLLALAFRLYRLDTPMADAHSWRQVTNADIARHFAETSANLFAPRVSWGGAPPALVGMEFPLLQWITGMLWRVTGENAMVARLVSIAFSVTAVWFIYLLGVRLFGRAAGLAAAFFMAVSPGVVFFGRSFLSDTPMVTFSIGAVLAWDRYFDRRQPGWAIVAAAVTALAGLVKLPAIIVFDGIAGLAWSRLRWRAFSDRGLIAGLAAALLAIAAWYAYADSIWQQTGLTQAVFRPSGTYPPDVAPGVAFTTVSHWATRERLMSGEFWWVMLDRLWSLYLTPYGFLAALIGIWLGSAAGSWALGLWTISGIVLVIAAAEGQFWHEFHTLPLVPPLMLYAGLAAAPLLDRATMQRYLPMGRWATAALIGVVLVTVSLQTFRASGAPFHLFRTTATDYVFFDAGPVIRSMSDEQPMITVDYYDGGANSPMMLYFAHRLGWSFDVRSISVGVIEHLRSTRGARYLATPRWNELQSEKPDVAAYLGQFKFVVLPGDLPGNVRLVDLKP
jgi:4-amino-4-deoxy-L-arabinose transferase-like glycosyltransferase